MTETQPLEVELMALAAAGEMETASARIRRLSLADYIRVMKSLQKLDNALCDYGEKWKSAEYWGRGMPYPDEEGGETDPRASEKNAGAALQAVA